ncbi:MAG: phosphate--acyl-ACP acyltransferase, partial [Planctomycetota bacterium]
GTEMKKQNLLMAWWFKKISKDVLKKYDYHEYGGALLLGVNGISVIGHGSSKARTIKNAALACKKFADKHINEQIIERLSQTTVKTNGQ